MEVRNRMKGLKKVKKADLVPHPKNWRTHPQQQQDALRGILAEVGNVAPIIARKLPDGKYQIVDGHLREETLPGEFVQILEVDLTDEEVDKVLVTFDAIGDLAGRDQDQLDGLLAEMETQSEGLQALFDQLAGEVAEQDAADDGETPAAEPPDVPIEEIFQVIVECQGEDDQRTVFEHMREKGYRCRAMTL